MAVKLTTKGKPAIKKPIVATKAKPKPKPKTRKPSDWLSGSTVIGKTYKAWDTYNQGKPDFGKGRGPGDPYRALDRVVLGKDRPTGSTTAWGKVTNSSTKSTDPKADAIRRRLRGL